MEQFGTELINLGVVSVIAYLLVSNVLAEKVEEGNERIEQKLDNFFNN